MEEIWKPILERSDYFVSNKGRVKSCIKGREEKLLSLCDDKDGYKQFNFIHNGRKISKRVHRAVMESFIGIDETRTLVNHKNSIRFDNRLENLEWCTAKENTVHCFANNYSISDETKKKHSQNNTGSNNPKARKVFIKENGMKFGTIKECIEYIVKNKLSWKTEKTLLVLYYKNEGKVCENVTIERISND